MRALLKQLILYALCGLAGVLVDFLIFITLQTFKIPTLLVNTISVTAGIFTSFLLNRRITFKRFDAIFLRIFSFFTVGILGLMLSNALILIFLNLFSNSTVAKILTLPFVLLFQFTLNRTITFSDRVYLFAKMWKRSKSCKT